MATLKPIQKIHTKRFATLHSARISPDGRLVSTTDMDGYAYLWDVQSGYEIPNRVLRGVWETQFNRDGSLYIVRGNRFIEIFDTATFRSRFYITNIYLPAACISHDDSKLLIGTNNYHVELWELYTNTLITFRNYTTAARDVCSVAFDQEGNKIACIHQYGDIIVEDLLQHEITFLRNPYTSASSRNRLLSFDLTGQKLFAQVSDFVIARWDTERKTCEPIFVAEKAIADAALSYDNSKLFVVTGKNSLHIVDVNTKELISSYTIDNDYYASIDVNHDCTRLVATTDNMKATVFELST